MTDELPRLTPAMASRKHQVLAFIRLYYIEHLAGPSSGEIAAGVGISRDRAKAHVRRLEAEGLIHRVPGVARSIRPIDAFEGAIMLLRARGYIINEDALAVDPPPLPVLDIIVDE